MATLCGLSIWVLWRGLALLAALLAREDARELACEAVRELAREGGREEARELAFEPARLPVRELPPLPRGDIAECVSVWCVCMHVRIYVYECV